MVFTQNTVKSNCQTPSGLYNLSGTKVMNAFVCMDSTSFGIYESLSKTSTLTRLRMQMQTEPKLCPVFVSCKTVLLAKEGTRLG